MSNPASERPATGAPETAEAYDALVTRLERVVGELESGQLSLEGSIEKFAEGVKLAHEATRKLDDAERRIEMLIRNADGSEEAVPLDPEGWQGALMKEETPRKPKVIIVDDDRDTREMLTLALELEGFDVGQAANGLRLISAMHVDRPDVILLDVMMSWIDGFELCRAIKKNSTFHDIPVIFISARKSVEDERTGLEAGAVDDCPKPLDIDRLIARIRQILDQRGTPVAAAPV